MNRRKPFLIVISLLFLIYRPVSAEIRIGAALPLSGQFSSIGEHLEFTIRLAVSDINSAGGVLNQELILFLKDDQGSPTVAHNVARWFSRDTGVVLVIGHFSSSCSIVASEVYSEARILQITPSSSNPELTESGKPFLFRLAQRHDAETRIIPEILSKYYRKKSIAVLYDNVTRDLTESFANELKRIGINTSLLPRPYISNNLAGVISDITTSKADAIYSLPGKEAVNKLLHLNSLGNIDAHFLFFEPEDYSQKQSARSVVENFRNNFESEPDDWALQAYAAVQVWAQAANRANSIDAELVSNRLKSTVHNTIIGQLQFDQMGDLNPAAAGTTTSCGKTCPSECNNNCERRNESQCCDIASMPRPPIP